MVHHDQKPSLNLHMCLLASFLFKLSEAPWFTSLGSSCFCWPTFSNEVWLLWILLSRQCMKLEIQIESMSGTCGKGSSPFGTVPHLVPAPAPEDFEVVRSGQRTHSATNAPRPFSMLPVAPVGSQKKPMAVNVANPNLPASELIKLSSDCNAEALLFSSDEKFACRPIKIHTTRFFEKGGSKHVSESSHGIYFMIKKTNVPKKTGRLCHLFSPKPKVSNLLRPVAAVNLGPLLVWARNPARATKNTSKIVDTVWFGYIWIYPENCNSGT